ncbi:MAG: response regulator [Desulfamplus sp.]|nr:response regulator [Desulfamplus sp.]
MKQTINVLIVEDTPDDFLLLKELLESSDEINFNTFHEERIENAKAFVKHHSVDIAVIDLTLPDSFGLDTFRTFHNDFPHMPIVIITAFKEHELALQAVKEGAQDYLFKGESSASEIFRTLRYAIERQKLMSELKKALAEIKQLKSILPICAKCKKIRNDQGCWEILETYISEHTNTKFSHGICPDCAKVLYPELYLGDKR